MSISQHSRPVHQQLPVMLSLLVAMEFNGSRAYNSPDFTGNVHFRQLIANSVCVKQITGQL